MKGYTIESNKKKSRLPARLDFLQSGTGLFLGLFVWAHIFLNASIILGPGAFNWVSRNMALAFLSDTGQGYPIAVFFAVFVVFTLFIIHAMLGMRKFPNSWKQHRIMKDQMAMITHQDTSLWYIQVLSGFIMFFAGSVHLYSMLTYPGSIDSYLCAGRTVSANMWFVYLILLVCAVIHGNIGLYRLCMKWGWFQGADYQRARKIRTKLKTLRDKLIIVFLSVGLLALLIFVIIGLRHKKDEPCQPAYAVQPHGGEAVAVEQAFEKATNPYPAQEAPVPEAGLSHKPAGPEIDAAKEQKEPATPPVEENLPHDSAPAVREPEPAHEETENDQDAIREDTAGEDEAAREPAWPEAGPAKEQKEPATPYVEENLPHDSAPAVREPEPAHEEAENDQGAIREDAAGEDEAAREATGKDAGPLESEEHAAQEKAPHIEGGYGPQETL